MPRIYITGYVDLYVEVDGSNDLLWKGKFFVETPFQAPELVQFNKEEILAKEPPEVTIKWDYKNLTLDQNTPVSITLWGYREATINPEIVYIDTIAVSISVLVLNTIKYWKTIERYFSCWFSSGFPTVGATRSVPSCTGTKRRLGRLTLKLAS